MHTTQWKTCWCITFKKRQICYYDSLKKNFFTEGEVRHMIKINSTTKNIFSTYITMLLDKYTD